MDYDKPIFTISEVAKYLGVTKRTVFNLLQRSELLGFKVGKLWRFRKEDVDALIEKRMKSRSSKFSKFRRGLYAIT